MYVNMDIVEYGGRFNVAAETWLLNPIDKSVISEILIFLGNYGIQPYGEYLNTIYD